MLEQLAGTWIASLSSSYDENDPTDFNDALTGLPAREAFCRCFDRFPGLRRIGASATLLYLDLDRFKSVNSLHGRAVADQVLKSVAEKFRQSVGDAALLGRVGGDEFASLWLEPLELHQLASMAEEILRKVSIPARIGALDITVEPSIGIVLDASGAVNAVSLLQRAALAMYRARHAKLGYAFDSLSNPNPIKPLFKFGQGLLTTEKHEG